MYRYFFAVMKKVAGQGNEGIALGLREAIEFATQSVRNASKDVKGNGSGRGEMA